MNRLDLYIRYKTNGQFEKKIKLAPRHGSFVMGKSVNAQLILGGQDVSPLHSAVEYRKGEWVVMDLASESGTWINDEAITEEKIIKPIVVRIGGHTLELETKECKNPLYVRSEYQNQGNDLQEVIVKTPSCVLNTHLIGKDDSFVYYHDGKEHHLKAPRGTEIAKTQMGRVMVLQRLVQSPPPVQEEKTQFGISHKTVQLSVMTLVGFSLIIGLIMLFPHAPVEEEIKKPELNAYTRLIFDKNVVQAKRKQAMTITKQKFDTPQKAQAPNPSAETRKVAQAAPKVITNIKASGLQQLLGKIATRQNSFNKNIIQTRGSTDYEKARGIASSVGTATVGGVSGGVLGGTSKGIKTAAINTKGLGGGGNIQGYGTLSNGGIGTADVGVVEEEVDVGGGLDRDAVAAVIKSNIGQIRYCYERKLTANPNLYGKILIQFSIEGQGAVLRPKVSRTTLQDADVEGCILRRLSQWKFPTPPSGTSVLVTYPFLFKSTQ